MNNARVTKKAEGPITTLLYVLAAIITIGGFCFGITRCYDLFPGINPNSNQNTIEPELQPPPFDFNKLGIVSIKPIRPFFYSGGTAMIIYDVNYPFPMNKEENITQLTVHGELFRESKVGKREYVPNFDFDSNLTVHTGRQIWHTWFFANASSDNDSYEYVIFIEKEKEWHNKSTTFFVVKNDAVTEYLLQDKNILWDQSIYDWINSNAHADFMINNTEDEQAKILFNLVWKKMLIPGRYKLVQEYDNKTDTSLNSFNEGYGTSSEFAYVYTMLLRAIGIPAKYKNNIVGDKEYYYVQYYSNQSWIDVDIFNKNYDFGDCITFENKFIKDVKIENFCLRKEDFKIKFLEITPSFHYEHPDIAGVMVLKGEEELPSYKIKLNVTGYDENDTMLFQEETYLSFSAQTESIRNPVYDLKEGDQYIFSSLMIGSRSDYAYLKINLI